MSESGLRISIFFLKRGMNISKITLKNIQTGELICEEALKMDKRRVEGREKTMNNPKNAMNKGKDAMKASESSMKMHKEALKVSKSGELNCKEALKIDKSRDEGEQRKT